MKYFLIILFNVSIIYSQPDPRYEAFDWVLYTQQGSVTSISEGFRYAYFATEFGGILRYNLYSNKFEEPITTAQGLVENNLTAVYFDESSGILWAASNKYINYSFDAKGNWNNIKLADLGLKGKQKVWMIGSTENFIWLNAGSVYIKLDKVSAIPFGNYPVPDELNIIWSSPYITLDLLPDEIMNYTIMEGWVITPTNFIDPYGKWIDLSSYYYGQNSNIYIGLEDGTIFIGKTYNEVLYPYSNGLNQNNIIDIYSGQDIWLVGDSYYRNVGITKYSNNEEFIQLDFENEINFNPDRFNEVLETKNELWFGGSSKISIYNKKDRYWREIGEEHGLPNSSINTMSEDETSVLVGTNSGLVEISKITKYVIESELEKGFLLSKINDLEMIGKNLWIASKRNLYIFSKEKNTITNYKLFGNVDKISRRMDGFSNFTDINNFADKVYIATNIGVLCYNIKDNEWEVCVEPSQYGGSYINNIAVRDNYCFLNTDSGIWQINMKGGYSRHFDYKFIGRVNDLIIKDDILFIGSDKGFIKYLWKKNI